MLATLILPLLELAIVPLFQAGGCYEPKFGTRHENVLGLVVALAQMPPILQFLASLDHNTYYGHTDNNFADPVCAASFLDCPWYSLKN